jgi:hypothetical protein
MTTIAIEVADETARAYHQAPPDEQRKLQLLLELRLRELTTRRVRPLREILDEARSRAAAAGLTPEILESLIARLIEDVPEPTVKLYA